MDRGSIDSYCYFDTDSIRWIVKLENFKDSTIIFIYDIGTVGDMVILNIRVMGECRIQ